MTIRLDIPDRGELAALQTPWRRLHRASGAMTPDADPDRYQAVLEAFGPRARPHLAVLRNGGDVDGLVVARIQPRRAGARIGYLTVPAPTLEWLEVIHGGVLGVWTGEGRAVLVTHCRTLLARGAVEAISFNRLGLDDPLRAALLADPVLRRHSVSHRPEPHWRLALEGSFEGLAARRSRKRRFNLRRSERLLGERFGGNVRVRCVTAAGDLERFIADAQAVQAAGYQRRLSAGISDVALWRRILRTEARLGRLRCYCLEGGGTPIAFQVGVVYGSTYHLQATAFVPRHAACSPGQVLHQHVLGDLCDAGLDAIDFGFGDASYKRRDGSRARMEATLNLYAAGARARAARLVDRGADAIGGLAERAGVSAAIKRRWRARLAGGKPS